MRELNLLQHIYQTAGARTGRVTIPPGDDMGAVRIGETQVLVTVDQLADGVHVDLAVTSIEKIAHKAMARSLSDVAAMAAVPLGAVVAASLPRDFGEQRATELCDAIHAVGERYDCPVFGGDISMWDQPMLLCVTVLAEPGPCEPILRSTAKPGDAIFVTGELGASLEMIDGVVHHLDFEPRVQLALSLARDEATRPTSMIDLSDGLAIDLPRICRMSGIGATLDARAIPVSARVQQAVATSGRHELEHALGDGEDYELCFTINADRAAKMPGEVDGVPVHRVGEMVEGKPAVRLEHGPPGIDMSELGWDHRGEP